MANAGTAPVPALNFDRNFSENVEKRSHVDMCGARGIRGRDGMAAALSFGVAKHW